MALLHQAFEPIQCSNKDTTNAPKSNDIIVGSAYGPEHQCGIAEYGVYKVKMNPYTNKLYVIGRTRDEQVNEDGTVVGCNKRYKMSFNDARHTTS
jgi:hypothetical protein